MQIEFDQNLNLNSLLDYTVVLGWRVECSLVGSSAGLLTVPYSLRLPNIP